MKVRETCTCPLELVHDMIKGKWKSTNAFDIQTIFAVKDRKKSQRKRR